MNQFTPFLIFVLFSNALLCQQNVTNIQSHSSNCTFVEGGIVRTDTTQKNISLVFTGHEFADGADTIIKQLNKHDIKANFFFTGDFYRNPEFERIITKLIEDGHYLGAHSDKHLLYCDWNKRDSTLVSEEKFNADIENNYQEMNRFGIDKERAKLYMPPYEWYNLQIVKWSNEIGLTIVNYTPGTYSNADYTIPSMGKQYRSSDFIFTKILEYESNQPNGLNGFILLTHIGTHPDRTDKFYFRLDELLSILLSKGYSFRRLDELIN